MDKARADLAVYRLETANAQYFYDKVKEYIIEKIENCDNK